ncbi:MAG: hypothetical protein A3G66_01450 [Candidatus Levybacteria bacterium RIFCSPLOWO2_12_FULL_39_17]|nr:MAG: hypothetical protein A3G66_01450 [Candidatus Levybacteria bacterium RIFCSPLOWO2_12_FULL_39_17]
MGLTIIYNPCIILLFFAEPIMVKRDSLPKTLTVGQVADLLSVHPETVRRWDRTEKLVAIRVGNRGHRRYLMEEILKILNNKKKT